jgi:hypothetical protein
MKTPNPNLQTSKKFQISNPNARDRPQGLELGAWDFFEIWVLGFGILADH